MPFKDNEDEQLRSVALQNAQSIHLARRRAEENLRKQSEWLRVTLSSIGDAVISTDADGAITFMNRVAESLTGWSQESALGRPLATVFRIVNEESREPVENPALKALHLGRVVGLTNHTILIAKDGTEWPIDDSAAPIRNDEGEVSGVVVVFRDITHRKLQEAAQAERARLINLRADVSTALASGAAMKVTLSHCCEALVRHLDVAFAGIWMLSDGENVLQRHAHAGVSTHHEGPPERIEFGQFKIGRVASTREPYLTNNLGNDPNVSDRAWVTRHGMAAFAGYPLNIEDRLLGVVAIFAKQQLSEGMLKELAPIADGLAQYIERRRARKLFRRQAELLSVTLASIGDAVLTTDDAGNVTYLNPVAQAITGWTDLEARGKPLTSIFKIINEQTRQTVENPVRGVLSKGKIVGLANHTILIAKDGREIPIDDSAAPIKDPEGKLVGAVLVFRDITERKKAELEREDLLERARSAQKEAENANRVKDEFLATASHELRTPLTAVLGWTRMLRTGKLDEDTQAKALEAIERNAKLQTKLIEDLLDISRIITGKLNLDRQALEMTHVINDAVNTIRPAAAVKQITIETRFDSEGLRVLGDANRLQQVVWNLLSNAVKFTPVNGHIYVDLRRIDSQVEVSVRDTGDGINPEFLPHVFERFRQADSRTTRRHGGLGLGLAIARNLIELHGGSIEAKSEGKGCGANFSFRLPAFGTGSEALAFTPLLAFQDTADRNQLKLEKPPSLAGIRVLIVDDDADTREILNTVLSECEADVLTAASAAEALQEIQRQQPDVLVSDVGMPDVDGYQFIRMVREKESELNKRPIPALALTAYAKAEDRVRALASGYHVHLSKPVEPAEFLLVIGKLAARETP